MTVKDLRERMMLVANIERLSREDRQAVMEIGEVVSNAIGNFVHGRPSWAFKQLLTLYQGNAPRDVVDLMVQRLERNERCYRAVAARHQMKGHVCDAMCEALGGLE